MATESGTTIMDVDDEDNNTPVNPVVPVKVEPESDQEGENATFGSEYECDTDGQLTELTKLNQSSMANAPISRKQRSLRSGSRSVSGVDESTTESNSASDLSHLPNSSDHNHEIHPDPDSTYSTDLTCGTCGKHSKDKRLLKHHMKVVHTEEPAGCTKCNKTFKNIELLKVHNRRNHSGKTATYESRLIRDRTRKQIARKTTNTFATTCLICNVDFPYKAALKTHEKTEHISPETLTCPQCQKVFTQVEALKHHVRRIHLEPLEETTCRVCKLVLKSSRNLKIHLKNVHQVGIESDEQLRKKLIVGSCPICHKEFQSTNNLNRHIRSHESYAGKTYQCKLCPANFGWEDGLSLHMLLAHEREEFIICMECDKGFPNRIHFVQHYKVHEVWACELCDKLFRSQKYLRKHERKAHGESGSWTCPNCPNFTTQSAPALDEHVKLSHPEKWKSNLQEEIRKKSGENENTNWEHECESNQNFWPITPPTPPSPGIEYLETSAIPQDTLELPDCKFTPSSLALASAGAGAHPDHEMDGFFSPTSPNPWDQSTPSPVSPVSPVTRDVKPVIDEINIPPQVYEVSADEEDGPKAEPQPHTSPELNTDKSQPEPTTIIVPSKIDLENLKKCPKLRMRITVDVKKYKPLPCRKGYLFCTICCLNFFTPKSLRLHMERLHGIIYAPKQPSKAITEALKRLRAKGAAKLESTTKTKPKPQETRSNPEPSQSSSRPEQSTEINTESQNPDQPTFACNLCERSFDTKRKLIEHQKFIHGDMPQTCYICKTVLQNSQYLNRHMRWVHNHDPVVCDICGKEYGSALKLGMHKRRVHRAKIFTCTICRTDHKTKGSLRLHMRTTHEDDGTRYPCEQCSSTFKRKDYLTRHLEYAHGGKMFACDRCGREFKSMMTLSQHAKNHVEEENFRCLYCSAKFNTNKKKSAHEDRYHFKEEGYECKICKEMYDNSRALEKHVIYRHSEQDLEKLYYQPAKAVAAPPMKQYKSYNNLMMEPLKGAPPIQRKSKSDRIDGRKIVLTEEQKKERFKKYYNNPKSCSHCGTVCANRREIYKHIADAHPELARIRCEPCNLGFVISKFLHLHNAEVHRGGLPLTCAECGEGFFAADMLRYHMNTRHEGSQGCDLCDKRFPTVTAMKAHKEEQHANVQPNESTSANNNGVDAAASTSSLPTTS